MRELLTVTSRVLGVRAHQLHAEDGERLVGADQLDDVLHAANSRRRLKVEHCPPGPRVERARSGGEGRRC